MEDNPMNTERVTIRGVDREAISELRELAKFNGLTLGEAFSDAIHAWIDSLDEIDPDED